jgi:hypothetical protein
LALGPIEKDADRLENIVIAVAQEPFAINEVERLFLDVIAVAFEMLCQDFKIGRSHADAFVAATPAGALRTIKLDLLRLLHWPLSSLHADGIALLKDRNFDTAFQSIVADPVCVNREPSVMGDDFNFPATRWA